VDDSLILVRVLHFAATTMAAGVVFFTAFIAEPAFRAGEDAGLVAVVRAQLRWIALVSLALVVISGAAWLILISEQMSARPLDAVFSEGVIWTVVAQTEFGHDWIVRLILTGLLAAVLSRGQPAGQNSLQGWGAVAIAASLSGTLAWAGHAAATPGIEGSVHMTADVLHLIAAAAWVGALIPLAMLLKAAHHRHNGMSVAIVQKAVLRFSALGIVSVATLLATGTVSSWILTGSIPALVETNYGRLLLLKVALFVAMVSIAAVNRFRLTPRLIDKTSMGPTQVVLGQLRRNSLIEAATGAVILGIVAVLGTMPPSQHQHATSHSSIPLNTDRMNEHEHM
jgi:putative copper resistance protein D